MISCEGASFSYLVSLHCPLLVFVLAVACENERGTIRAELGGDMAPVLVGFHSEGGRHTHLGILRCCLLVFALIVAGGCCSNT